jgi:hypothetical protein
MDTDMADRDQDDFIQQDEDYYDKEDEDDEVEEPTEEELLEYEELDFDPDKKELERHTDITPEETYAWEGELDLQKRSEVPF